MQTNMAPWQYVALYNPFDHFAMFGGVAAGKTFTGSHFAINMMENYPEVTGFIGANTYDQLNQATLRELFYWLDDYGYEYVIDRLPPPHWGAKKKFKKYSNILSVYVRGKVVHAFTRVLSNENPLRGVEFSWYWLDESRDTPQDTHDVVLSRMRESELRKGIITTTPNGEDWTYNRFVKPSKQKAEKPRMYGSLHVKTIEAVKAEIITEAYYDTMRASYSPLMAAQELDAQHVNVAGGQAYYAFGDPNRAKRAPWGDTHPNVDRPLIVGCDFNYQPAPCIWMVGQTGPDLYGPNGEYWGDHIHWFSEVSQTQASTPDMTVDLISKYPDFFYEIYGDASGGKGTTSNAGEYDYAQMNNVLVENGCEFSIDYDQANPRVKDRVENMNRMAMNGLGQSHMTYNPDQCPQFDGDVKQVGWKVSAEGRGKLDSGGDVQRTHASDGAGYAVWKKFPLPTTASAFERVPSAIRRNL